ncbi:MAG: YegS/Rv2252/BmrU family lipid kinase [Lachnospiraceae bacterium]|nr:YegS/Rv2252/BmrU family lipid kinase [Lachnospiraceae bacterium]
MKKMLFVYNPMAGKEKIRDKLSDIIQEFCNAEFEVTIFATRAQGDVTQLIAERGTEFDYAVCSGGDGTMNEMAAGIMQLENPPVCGYIPAGTVNDFATSLKIPKIMKKAAAMVVRGNVFHCDLGQFNDRYFTYVAGFGAFTEVSHQTSQELKNTFGKTAYFMEALKHVAEIKPHHMKIVYDDGAVEDEFVLGLISNSESVAGFKAYAERDIKMDDGLFEALFVRMPKNPLELQTVLNSLVTRNLDNEQIVSISSGHFHIVSDDDIQWTLDGEDGGIVDEVDMVNHKRVLPIVCNRKH